jgi:hypothetical protein
LPSGEDQRLATEPDAVAEARGIERRRLERLPEAVHVDQDIAAAGLREKSTILLGHRLDRIEAPIAQPDRGEREAAVVEERTRPSQRA